LLNLSKHQALSGVVWTDEDGDAVSRESQGLAAVKPEHDRLKHDSPYAANAVRSSGAKPHIANLTEVSR
jgi:hypothetical protein